MVRKKALNELTDENNIFRKKGKRNITVGKERKKEKTERKKRR